MKRARTDAAKEERRQILLKAALDEFYEKGLAAARTDDIAERAGLSKGTLYLYFKSKDDVFKALIETLTSDKLAQLETLATKPPSLDLALAAFGQFAPTVVKEPDLPKLIKVLIGESQAFPELIEDYRKNVLSRILGALATMLENANARGEISIDDPALTARLVVAPVVLSGIWQAVFAGRGGDDIDLEKLFSTHTRFLLKAMKPGD